MYATVTVKHDTASVYKEIRRGRKRGICDTGGGRWGRGVGREGQERRKKENVVVVLVAISGCKSHNSPRTAGPVLATRFGSAA